MTYKQRSIIPVADRLFPRVDAEGICWLWTGALTRNGYGAINLGRNGAGIGRVHRVVWELLVGPIPAGLDLEHICRVRSCCNPDHLEPTTRQVNVDRGAHRAGKSRKTHCKHGHKLVPCQPCRPCATRRNRTYRARQKAA